MLRTKVGNASAGLTYDLGVMFVLGLSSKADITLQILNGNGIWGPAASGFLDNDKNRNLMLRVSPDVSDQLCIGGFGYYGNENQTGGSNTTLIAGSDATFDVASFQINALFARRIDNDPHFTGTTEEKSNRRIFR